MKTVFHYAAGPALGGAPGGAPEADVTVCPEQDDARLLAELLPEAEVLWHVLKPCTAEMIAAAPRLRLIQKIGVGVNTIDLDGSQGAGDRRSATCRAPTRGRSRN